MVKTVQAVFDGSVLRPDEPLILPPNTRVKVTVETLDTISSEGASFLDTARSMNLDGPPDWAMNLDSYLYENRPHE